MTIRSEGEDKVTRGLGVASWGALKTVNGRESERSSNMPGGGR